MCIVNNVYFCYWGLYVFFNKCLKVVSFFFFPLEGMFTDGEQNFPFEHQKNHLKKFFFFFCSLSALWYVTCKHDISLLRK